MAASIKTLFVTRVYRADLPASARPSMLGELWSTLINNIWALGHLDWWGLSLNFNGTIYSQKSVDGYHYGQYGSFRARPGYPSHWR